MVSPQIELQAEPHAESQHAESQVESIDVDLRHAIIMIARALDYVGIDDVNHGHRVGYIAHECAKRLGWPQPRQDFAFYAGLLHDCGVSSGAEHLGLLGGLNPDNAEAHCIRGHQYLQSCTVLAPFAEAIRYHHTRWADLKDLVIDPADKEVAALIWLADRVDTLRVMHIGDHQPEAIVLFAEQIAATILNNAGNLFNPDYACAMAELVRVDGFWYMMNQEFIESLGRSLGNDGYYDRTLTISEIIGLGSFLGRIVDAKSPFTYEHSERVALISAELAHDFGMSEWDQQQIMVAGLLHDIGKLRVPDAILHKDAKLESEEMSVIRRHSVDSGLALRPFMPGSSIPMWAANHHEKLDGSGYPFHLSSAQLDLPSRIIAVADIFQALAQNRPYRDRLSFGEIAQIMVPLVREKKIDERVFSKITAAPEKYYRMAIVEAP